MLLPFLLQNVAGIESLNQHDGIHPTAAGARIVADNVWAVLKPVVEPTPSRVSGPPRAGSRGDWRRTFRIAIELRDVSKTVMSGTEPLTILHSLSLQIPHGQFVAIVGPSGSGKSTLLRPARGPRCAILGSGADRSGGHHATGRGFARAPARREDWLRVPVLPPHSVADGPRERRGADGDRRAPPDVADGARPTRLLEGSRPRPVRGAIIIPRSCRAASSSASRSHARSPTIRRSSSRTNRPAISTAPTDVTGHGAAAHEDSQPPPAKARR